MPTETQLRRKRLTRKRKVVRPRRPRRPAKIPPMSSPDAQRTLIDEIDERQESVLNDLVSLNARVEELLNECLATREEQRLADEADTIVESVLTPDSAGVDLESEVPESTATTITLVGPNVLTSQSLAGASAPQEC